MLFQLFWIQNLDISATLDPKPRHFNCFGSKTLTFQLLWIQNHDISAALDSTSIIIINMTMMMMMEVGAKPATNSDETMLLQMEMLTIVETFQLLWIQNEIDYLWIKDDIPMMILGSALTSIIIIIMAMRMMMMEVEAKPATNSTRLLLPMEM